jgi:SAM-dependent methyltransferase
MNTFTLVDSILAKFEFAKFRENNQVYYSHRYNVSDAALKYLYILQRVENKINSLDRSNQIKVLELGCGDGHLLRIINQTFNVKCIGFDPILKTRRVKVNNLIRDKFLNQNKLFPCYHDEFIAKNTHRFDIIVDSCSLTHFDTKIDGEINKGWRWALNSFPQLLKNKGSFICATDVSELNPNNEFLKSELILKSFSEISSVKNVNTLNSDYKSDVLNNSMENIPFTRIASAQDKTLLNVLGFEAIF